MTEWTACTYAVNRNLITVCEGDEVVCNVVDGRMDRAHLLAAAPVLAQAVEAAYIWFAAEAEFPDEDADDYPPIDMLKTRIRAMRLVQKAARLLGWERPEVRVPTDGEDPIQPGDTVIVHGRSSDWRTDDRPESTEVIWPDTLINYDLTPEHEGNKP